MCDSPSTSRRFALGSRDVCLVGENPTCSMPACRDARVYGLETTDMLEMSTPFKHCKKPIERRVRMCVGLLVHRLEEPSGVVVVTS